MTPDPRPATGYRESPAERAAASAIRGGNLAGSPFMRSDLRLRIQWAVTRRDGLIGMDQHGKVYRIEHYDSGRHFGLLPYHRFRVTIIMGMDRLYYVVVKGRRAAKHVAGRLYVAAIMDEVSHNA